MGASRIKERRTWSLEYVMTQRGLSDLYFMKTAIRMGEILCEVDGKFHVLKLEVRTGGKWRSFSKWFTEQRGKFRGRLHEGDLRLRCVADHL